MSAGPQPGAGLARYRRRRAARVAVGVVVAMVAVSVAAAAALGLGGAAAAPPAAANLPPATDQVTRATLTLTERVSGRLDYGAAATVIARASADAGPSTGAPPAPGTLTWLPAVGAVVRPGQPAYRVDDRPVVLLSGRVPLWRVLTAGVYGPDAELLEANLRRFGYTGFAVEGTTITIALPGGLGS